MMKYLGIAILMLMTSAYRQQINAQIFSFDENQFGVTGGLNYSKIRHAHNPSSGRTSFQLGVFSQMPFSQSYWGWENEHFLQIQLEYNQAGEKGAKKTVYADNYLSLLLIYEYAYQYDKDVQIFLSAGPKLSTLVHQNVKNTPPERPYEIYEDGKANPFDVALVLMGGIKLDDNKMGLYLRTDYSFSDRYRNLNEYPTTGDPLAVKRKAQYSISLGISYLII